MLTNIFYLILVLLLIGLGASSPSALFYFDVFGPFSTLFVTVFSVVIYFFAIAVSYYIQQEVRPKAMQNTWLQISFLVPFTIPFVLFIALNDILKVLPLGFLNSLHSSAEDLAVFALNAALMLGTLVLLPLLMVFFWRCRSFDDPVLEEKLEGVCKRAGFKHRGLKILGVMPRALTAAIMGISGRFRYVLFTPALLERLSPHAIEAVLAHEIGHSQRRHLLMYPLLMFCVAVLAGIFFELIYGPAAKFLGSYTTAFPRAWQDLFSLLGFYVLYALLMAFLLRFVFGYFMRLFERQADLHVFELGMPAQHMIDALNEVAIYSGYTHNVPSWHHYSIQERIDFLQRAQDDPLLVKKHHQKVVRSLWAFFAFVIILIL
jgi:Zn-dependent protease with chaperone function